MANENLSEASSSEDSESVDTDEELQNAFAKKELKPGLHVLAPFMKKKDKVKDLNGLKSRLCDIKLNLQWVERLDVINEPAPLAPELSANLNQETDRDNIAHNDFQREMLFYRQAQASVLEALPKLHAAGISTKRPDDYFAQMAKTDEHMQRVRQVLIGKQVVMERREKVKKLRELRKYGKQVQQEVLKSRLKEKKDMMESLKKFRKKQKNNLDFLDSVGAGTSKTQSSSKQQQKKRGAKKGSKTYKDNRYGYGGQKKKLKYNDAKSSADVLDFNRKVHQPRKFNKKKQGGAKGKIKGRQKKGQRK